MPTFTPPTTQFQYPTGNPLLDRMRPVRGVCVFSTDSGTTWKTAVYPWHGDLGYVDPLTGQQTRQEGIDYFLGGHTYTITSAQATALTAAGFGSYIT